ncbi:cyclodeaminase/cyclohydrolase family protein [Thermophilibacter immobilis]|jgi:formiminotetrahydrofolate cyclodeaminase|uniref:Cyclodeaminase/cyclohydrolase family protein n=1 Tax=Thermophilibacter immobilis TaxID=2779519 RepID=A0A7S7RU14_9ACTN|nr:cyclodeaminase/cyclohydrolase family protein [Thermophilibacter immobilis]QOY59957.1 cyclodeaminase/cyclohydrolase family protein [Thermophilibacter immobilis]
MQRLTDKSCAEFAGLVAAKQPTPGGGGAAALVGSLAAALCSMVGSYTTGKRRYADVESDVARMRGELDDARASLLDLVEADAVAFEPLSVAYGVPREDPTRARTLEEATESATEPPLQVMRQVCHVIELLEEMGQKGSRALLSDVGCGALLARAALEAASLNVFVNTHDATDRAWAARIEAACDEMLACYVPRAQTVAEGVTDHLRGRD